jgi:sulfur-oxidizing protein SoxX
MMKTLAMISGVAGAIALLAGCAGGPSRSEAEYRQLALDTIKRDFQAKGQAKYDRLTADEVQQACNAHANTPPADLVVKLTGAQLAGIKLPADNNYLGDWKEGEKIAQSGRGFTWSDKATDPAGGNCYNCHQIGPQESSFGTVGPSLLGYGKTRGNSPEMQKYTYSKIYNSKAFNLCSEMPRFGHAGALNETQIKHLVALLLDPASPVNK